MTWINTPVGSGGGGGGGGNDTNSAFNARLTLESGVPVSVSDQSAKSTLYLTPFRGNQISIYTGSAWANSALAEISIALSGLTSGLPYDVFVFLSTGVLTLELVAWTDGVTRATALAVQDGVYVKTAALTHRYVGTIRTTGTTTTADTLLQRFVWNYYNRVGRSFQNFTADDRWDYTSATWRYANGASSNRVECVVGVNEDPVLLSLLTSVQLALNTDTARVGIGLDVNSDPPTSFYAGAKELGLTSPTAARQPLSSTFNALVGIGYHYLAWLEYGAVGASSVCTFSGDEGGGASSGLSGHILA
ncbi:MAG: hypothetical protein ACREJN_21325 [Nitrospiraceae bacterium]